MSQWVCCNSCFKSVGAERRLAVTSCGHVVCSVCFQKGEKGKCLICKAKCQLSPLSDKSSSEVKALFSDVNTIATKYFSEISKVLQFQSRQQKRLLAHYQQKNENMKEALVKLQQELQQMSKKVAEQSAYITKLEVALQYQRLGSESNSDLRASSHIKPTSSLTKITHSSPVSLHSYSSTSGLAESMESDSRGFSHNPEISGSFSRLCVISPPQDGRIGTVPHRSASQSTLGRHSVLSASVSREFSSSLQEPTTTPSTKVPYRRVSPWEMPVFKMPPAYMYPSMSSLGPPP